MREPDEDESVVTMWLVTVFFIVVLVSYLAYNQGLIDGMKVR